MGTQNQKMLKQSGKMLHDQSLWVCDHVTLFVFQILSFSKTCDKSTIHYMLSTTAGACKLEPILQNTMFNAALMSRVRERIM